MAAQVYIDRLTSEIAALTALIMNLSEAPLSTVARVVSYTVHGRQVTVNSTTTAEILPQIRKDRDSLMVELARAEAGGVQVFYGVPRW